MGKRTDELKESIRVYPVKIMGVEGMEFAEAKRMWRGVSIEVQRVLNRMGFAWRLWHEKKKSPAVLRRWMAEYEAWVKADKKGRGKKPLCPIQAVPKECSNAIYHDLAKQFKSIHGRCIVLAMNRQLRIIAKKKASKSAYGRWMKVLLNEDSHESFARPQPIPFDSKKSSGTATLLPPATDKDPWRVSFRVDRFEGKTRAGKKKGDSHEFVAVLKSTGRKCQGIRKMLERCHSGEWKFCGSLLVEESKGWDIKFCYQMPTPERADVDPERVAYLWPRTDWPFSLRIPGRTMRVGGRGKLIAHKRLQYFRTKDQRKEAAKLRRSKMIYPHRHSLADFKMTFNRQLCAQVMRVCQEHRIGTVVWCEPSTTRNDTRFVVKEGQKESWPWYLVKTYLEQAGAKLGIAIVARAPVVRKPPRPLAAAKPSGNGTCAKGSKNGKPKRRKRRNLSQTATQGKAR